MGKLPLGAIKAIKGFINILSKSPATKRKFILQYPLHNISIEISNEIVVGK